MITLSVDCRPEITKRGWVECSSCKSQLRFVGLDCPLYCSCCGEIMPDALDLFDDFKYRLHYSLDDAIYV